MNQERFFLSRAKKIGTVFFYAFIGGWTAPSHAKPSQDAQSAFFRRVCAVKVSVY